MTEKWLDHCEKKIQRNRRLRLSDSPVSQSSTHSTLHFDACASYVSVDFVYYMYCVACFAANLISRTIKSKTRFSTRDSGRGEMLKVNR